MTDHSNATPGPYEVHVGNDYIVVMRGDESTDEGIMFDNEADAHLFAQAPAMVILLRLDHARIGSFTMDDRYVVEFDRTPEYFPFTGDYTALVDAIGWERCRAAIKEIGGDQ